MSKRPVNLTLHDKILGLADELMESLHYSSLSTMVEDLVRDEYERRHGPLKMADAPNSNADLAAKILRDAGAHARGA